MTLHESLAQSEDGRRRLASARLRFRVLEVLHEALEESKLTKADVARILGIRKSAVSQVFRGDGNLRVNTLAEYLWSLGYELSLDPVVEGAPRIEATRPRPRLDLVWENAPTLVTIDQTGNLRPDTVRPWEERAAG